MKLYTSKQASIMLGIEKHVVNQYARENRINAKRNEFDYYRFELKDIYDRLIQMEKPVLSIIESTSENDRYFIIADTVRLGNVQIDFRVVDGYVFEDFKSKYLKSVLIKEGFNLVSF